MMQAQYVFVATSAQLWNCTQIGSLTASSCFHELSMCCCALRPSWKCCKRKQKKYRIVNFSHIIYELKGFKIR